MERPGGPTPPVAAGAGAAFPVSDDSITGAGAGAGSLGDSSYDAADGSCRPSQVPASAKRVATSASLVTGWLFNVARETAPPSAGPGPVACAYGAGIGVAPSSLPRELSGMGGPAVLFPLLQRAHTERALCWALGLIRRAVRGGGASAAAYMQSGGGYTILAGLLRTRRVLLGADTVRACFEMAVDRVYDRSACSVAGARGNDDGSGGGDGATGEDEPWGGLDKGRIDPRKAEKEKLTGAWGWEKDLIFMPREEVKQLLRRAGVDEVEGEDATRSDGEPTTEAAAKELTQGERRLCPFVLLTDPYALKNLVMNHQVNGSGGATFVATARIEANTRRIRGRHM